MSNVRRLLRLALLGCDDDVLELVRACRRSSVGECVAAHGIDAGPSGARRELALSFSEARLDEPWENWLTRKDVDAVVVAGMSPASDDPTNIRELRVEQLKKLVQGQVPLLVMHPGAVGIDALEIEMLRADAKSVIVPAEPRCRHPAIDSLAVQFSAADAPQATRLVMTRRLPRRERGDVLRWFARDLETLKRLIGRVVKLSAAGPALPTGEDVFSRPDRKPSLSELVIHVQGESGLVARWSVEPAHQASAPTATLCASWDGAADEPREWKIEMAEDSPWRTIVDGRETLHESFDPAVASVETLSDALLGKPTAPAWIEAARGLDVAGAVDRALTRGRSVEFFNEELTEQASFKAVMSVWGCLIVLASGAGLFVGAIVWRMMVGRGPSAEDIVRPDAPSPWRWVQLCFVVPLAAFLLAQLLLWGLKQREAAPASNDRG